MSWADRVTRVTIATLFAMLVLACASSAALAYGTITGTVTNSSGAPVDNVEVDVYYPSGEVLAMCTDVDGTYDANYLPAGTYHVGFAPQGGPDGGNCFPKLGYEDQYYNDKSSLASSDPVSVSDGVTASGIDAVLSATAITGTVTDASTHAGIGGVQVDLLAAPGPNGRIIEEACSGSDGSYSFWQLDPGTYYVYFYPSVQDNDCSSGVNYLPQYYNGKASGGDPVSVSSGSVSSGIDAALAPGGQVTGRVTDATGAGIPNVSVGVFNSADRQGSYACTRADGTYTVQGLPTDNYQVQFTAQKSIDPCPGYGYDNFGTTAYNGSVSVTAGSTVSGIDEVLHSGPEVTGTVTDADTHATLAGVEVDLYDSGGSVVKSACSASDGTYSFSDLGTGSYRVGFQPTAGQVSCGPGLFYFPQYYSGASSLASANPISVTSGGATVSNVNAALHSQWQVTGTVRDASSNAGLAGVEVDLYDSSGSLVTSTCSASDGTYAFAGLSAGNYRAGFDPTAGTDVCGPGLEYFGQFYNRKASLALADQIPVSVGATASGIDAALVAGGKITGTVIDASSRAMLPNVEVDVYDSSGKVVAHACTASNGTYTVSMLSAGTYRVGFVGSTSDPVCATAIDYVTQYFNKESTLAAADPVSVSSASTSTSVNAKLSPVPPPVATQTSTPPTSSPPTTPATTAATTPTTTVTTTATSPSSPTPPPSVVRLVLGSRPASTALGVRLTLSCKASATQRCRTTETLTARRGVVIGKRSAMIAGGHRITLLVTLNSKGRRLLARSGRLRVTLTVLLTQGGHTTRAGSPRLMLTTRHRPNKPKR